MILSQIARSRRFSPRAAWIIATVVLCSLPAKAQEDRLTKLLQQEKSVLDQLQYNVNELTRTESKLVQLRQQHERAAYEISEIERRLHALRQRLQERNRSLRNRLLALHRMSSGGYVRLLTDGAKRTSLVSTAASIERLVKRDLAELASQHREQKQLEQLESELQQQQSTRATTITLLKNQRETLRRRRKQGRNLLRRIGRNRRAQRRLLRELTAAQESLMKQISRGKSTLRRPGGFATQRGRIKQPVRGTVVGHFSESMHNDAQLDITRNGLTFRCKPRAVVHAVHLGIVRSVTTVRGFGHVVLIDHGNGYLTLTGFLASTAVAEGQRIAAGEKVGNAGVDPLSTKPAVYFELHRFQETVDPLPWITR